MRMIMGQHWRDRVLSIVGLHTALVGVLVALHALPAAGYTVLVQTQNFTDDFVRQQEDNGATVLSRTTSENLPERTTLQSATADLNNGLLRSRVSGTLNTTPETAFGLAQAILVDTVHFTSPLPFSWDFRLRIDGTVFGNQHNLATNPNNFLFFTGALFIYDAPTGFAIGDYFVPDDNNPTDPNDNHQDPLFYDQDIRRFGNSTHFNIAGSIPVPAGVSDYEIFMSMRTSAVCQGQNTTPGCSYDVNFANTATFEQNFPLFAVQTSDSGVLPVNNFTPTAIPEPATWLLLGAGLVSLCAVSRRRWRRAA
jgi:hypothetical protein